MSENVKNPVQSQTTGRLRDLVATHRTLSRVVLRACIVAVDYVLVMFTALSLIPAMGVFVYDKANMEQHQGLSNQLAYWLVPFVFVIVMVAVAEVTAMRMLWRAGTRALLIRDHGGQADLTLVDGIQRGGVSPAKRVKNGSRTAKTGVMKPSSAKAR